jgi:hypothetical protein
MCASSTAVRKPAASGLDQDCTDTDRARTSAGTTQEASSGHWPPGAMRTRRMSSASAVTRMVELPICASKPSARAVTTARETTIGASAAQLCQATSVEDNKADTHHLEFIIRRIMI